MYYTWIENVFLKLATNLGTFARFCCVYFYQHTTHLYSNSELQVTEHMASLSWPRSSLQPDVHLRKVGSCMRVREAESILSNAMQCILLYLLLNIRG